MSTILAGTARGLFGAESPMNTLIPDHDVRAVMRAGRDLWALVGRKEVRRSADDRPFLTVASIDGHDAVCLQASPHGVWVGCAAAHLLRLDGDTFVVDRAFEDAEGREGWYTPWGGPPDIRSISTGTDGDIWVNVHVGGILRSDDAGTTWRPTIDIHTDVHQVLDDPVHGRVFAATAQGLAASRVRGATWEFRTEGLHALYCRAVVTSDDTVLVTASDGPHGGRAAIYRAGVEVGKFERCERGLPGWFAHNIDTYCVASHGTEVAFGTADGEIYLSTDSGARWDRVADGLPRIRCVMLD